MPIGKKEVEIFNECWVEKKPIYFAAGNLNISFQSRILNIEKDKITILNTVPPQYISLTSKATMFTVQINMIKLQVPEMRSDGQNIVLPFVNLQTVEESRIEERQVYGSTDQIYASFTNPFDGVTMISKPIMDMSETGFSLRTPERSLLFEPDSSIGDITIQVEGKEQKKCHGTVIYTRKFLSINRREFTQVGFETRPA